MSHFMTPTTFQSVVEWKFTKSSLFYTKYHKNFKNDIQILTDFFSFYSFINPSTSSWKLLHDYNSSFKIKL